MDTEEHIEINHAKNGGYPYTDEGPYYHHAWWESYKGGVKGKLGGLVIGALIGAAAGVAAAAALSFAGIGAAGIAAVIGGFAAGGMVYGAHEFNDVGHISGAVAAGNELSEQRMRTYESGKFAEIKQELSEIKNLIGAHTVSGQTGIQANADENAKAIKAATELDNWRTTHYQPEHADKLPGKNKFIFWKVAAIGLGIGLIAGALLAGGGFIEPLLHSLGNAFGGEALETMLTSTAGKYIASMTAMGAIGASFGINRDIFRQTFDKTDLWFRGLISGSNPNTEHVRSKAIEKTVEKEAAITPSAPATDANGLVYDDGIKYPESGTYHRDKVLAAAQQAMHGIDPSSAIRH
jgi:hypothetical protein